MSENKSVKLSINVVTRMNDNQDGGYTFYVYNSEEEMLADHPKINGSDLIPEEYEKLKEEILSGDDEYENGYIGSDTINVIIKDGVARLDGNLSFHCGQ